MRNKLSVFTYKFLRILFIFIMTIIIVSRLFIGVRSTIYEITSRDLVIFRFFNIYVLIFIAFIIYVSKKYKNKTVNNYHLDIYHFLTSFLIGIIALKVFGYTPQYDSENCVTIANLILQNNLSADINFQYLDIYPFQIGYSSIILLFQLISSNLYLLLIQLFQIFIYSIANVILFRMARNYLNSQSFVFEFILSLLWFVPYLCSPYVYGISLGLSFTIFSLYFFVKWINNEKNIGFVLSMIFLIIACVCKPNYILIGITYLLYYIFFFKNSRKKYICCLIGLCVSLFISLINTTLISNVFFNTQLNDGVSQLTYLVMGNMDSSVLNNDINNEKYMKYVAPGHYNGYNYYSYINNDGNQELISLQNKENLREELSFFIYNPSRAVKFYSLKFAAMWDSVDFYLLHHIVSSKDLLNNQQLIDSLDNGPLNSIYTLVINCSVMSLLCGSLYLVIKKKNIDTNANALIYIVIIYFFGGFFYHMLFEGKSIYIVSYITLLIPLAIKGLEYLSSVEIRFDSKKAGVVSIPIILIVLAFMFIYNRSNLYLDVSKELYYDNSTNIPLANNYLTYEFSVDKDSTAIEFYTEGLLDTSTLNISLYDNDDNVYYYTLTQDQLQDSGYQYVDLKGLVLKQGINYTIVFNLNDSDNTTFTIPFGQSSYASENDKVILNGVEHPYSTINFKTYSYFHSNMFTYDHNYNQSLSELYYFGG